MKKILFLTGTRADFGKLKSLIKKVHKHEGFESNLFVTGMHLLKKYGMTYKEVEKAQFCNIHKYINQNEQDTMDSILAKTINGLSDYVKENNPDMIVVHGDRVEALAGAIVGSLNNILVSHIEGGEISGTIDELIRHSVSKMSHLHFVCNELAKQRLEQLGELSSSIHVIGSPDLDIMTSAALPSLDEVKERYAIEFSSYSVFMYHPVTTEVDSLDVNIKCVVNALINSGKKFVVIYPNNDHGTDIIINELKRLDNNSNFRVFPSIRFEYFLTLLKNCDFIIGNSSAGIREVPYYGRPTINIGSRQKNRSLSPSIINVHESEEAILNSIKMIEEMKFDSVQEFGYGNSDQQFIKVLSNQETWNVAKQKQFIDIIKEIDVK